MISELRQSILELAEDTPVRVQLYRLTEFF
jgi:hypothetical protein